ncbi:MAG TPA: hypothetical protein PKK50_06485 [Myxococcota bacterium]|nr:hypothetical protein [Myxococcota bacterium]HOD06728.1 hypothetical protein [Myxococcota bacterium]
MSNFAPRFRGIILAGALAVMAAVSLPGSAALAGDFMDTRLTWSFGDDDLMANAGQVIPDSPITGIGDRPGYEMFMDNLNSRTSGRENLTHLVLYKEMPGFLKGLTTEAALVMRLDMGALTEGNNPGVDDVLQDDGSYLRAAYTWDSANPQDKYLALTLFPFSTERFRLGYLYDISWGGGNIFTNNGSGLAPGLRLDVHSKMDNVTIDAFAGFKTAKVKQVVQEGSQEVEQISVKETNYGVLGGIGVDIYDWVRLDLGAGYFQQGTFERTSLMVGQPVWSAGLSARVTVRQGLPIQSSVDFKLYRNHPDINVVDWWKEQYTPKKFSWSVSGEFSYAWQQLESIEQYAETSLQPAWAGAVQVNFKYDYMRFQIIGLIRNLEFILLNVPSLTPFVAIPENGVSTTPEYFLAATLDYRFDSLHLTPFITGGVQMPATFVTDSPYTVQVVRDETRRDRLPEGYEALPIGQLRAGVQWEMSDFFSLIGAFQYARDENQTRLEYDSSGQRVVGRQFLDPNKFGFNIMVMARF